MKERTIHFEAALIPHHQAAEVAQPGERPLHLPPPPVAAQLPTVLQRRPLAVAPVRADQLDAPPRPQPLPQPVAVIALVADQPLQLRRSPPAVRRPHVDVVQRPLEQRHLRRAGRVEVACQRNALAIDHHHPLRTLAFLGLAHPVAPFFAGAKLPSAKHSAQSRRPWSCKASRRVCQACRQTPCSSHRARRRQQVEGEGYPSGSAFQRPPLRSTHRMPSTTGRLGTGLGPPLGEGCGSGRTTASSCHCSSVSSGWRMLMTRLRAIDTSCPGGVPQTPCHTKTYIRRVMKLLLEFIAPSP